MRAILVNIYPGLLLCKNIPARMVSLVDDKAPPAGGVGFMRKYGTEQARADDQIIILAAGLSTLLAVTLQPLHTGSLLLVHLISVADRLRFAAHDHLAVVKPQDMVAQTPHRIQIVRNIQKRRSSRQKLLHTALAPLAELIVADRQNLIDNQDIRLNHRRHRESKPRLHTGRIILNRRIQEFLDLGEFDYLIKMSLHELPAVPQHSPVQENILPGCHFEVKARAQLDHRSDRPAHPHRPAVRLQNPRDRLEERGLARPVPADQPPRLALLHMKVHILQREELLEHELPLRHLDRVLLQVIYLLVGEIELNRQMVDIYDIPLFHNLLIRHI